MPIMPKRKTITKQDFDRLVDANMEVSQPQPEEVEEWALVVGEPTAKKNGLAARIAANRAAVKVVPPTTITYPPGLTDEQVAILDVARQIESAKSSGQKVLVICAGAGTGKTFTLKQLEQVLQGKGQYTAFNKSLVEDSRPKFKKAAVNTSHSLAFGSCGKRFAHRLNTPRLKSHQMAKALGIEDVIVQLPPKPDGTPTTRRLSASYLAGQVMVTVKRFCQSADRELGFDHLQRFANLDTGDSTVNSDRVRDYLLPFAVTAWADLSCENGKLPFAHDHYVKVWQLEGAVIGADYILLDEYQDTAPVFLDCLMQQKNALLILVGDDNQRIYEWRGAVNAGDYFPNAPRRLLSQSFRFGQAVADVANSILSRLEKPTDLVMRGCPTIPSRVCEVKEPKCWLYRTNAGALGRLMQARSEGKTGHLIGKVDDVVEFCKAALDLQSGRSTTHPELGCFDSWKEVQAYSNEDEGADLRLMVRLIDRFKADGIIKALECMPDEDKADVVLSTAHRSKGREWTSVKLGGDFPTANKLSDSDLRLLYVAATRAQEELDLTICPTFCGGYDMGWGEGGEEEVWMPGIEIKYTVPMPTPEELAAYRAVKVVEVKKEVVNGKPPDNIPGGGNTWAKGKKGDWLVRGKPGQTGTVTVYKKDGSKQEQTIKKCIWKNEEAALYEV